MHDWYLCAVSHQVNEKLMYAVFLCSSTKKILHLSSGLNDVIRFVLNFGSEINLDDLGKLLDEASELRLFVEEDSGDLPDDRMEELERAFLKRELAAAVAAAAAAAAAAAVPGSGLDASVLEDPEQVCS